MLHLLEDYNIDVDIWIDISDIQIGATIIKRKAQVYALRYALMERRVELLLQKYFYATNADGSYGESMANIDGIQTMQTLVVAKNEYLIDMATQDLIGPATDLGTEPGENGRYDAAFAVGQPLNGKEVMRDFDFYKLIAATQPVILDVLIYEQATGADQRGLL